MFAWAITAVMLGRSAVAVMVMTMAPLALVLLQFVIFSYLFRGKHRLDLSFGLGTAGFHLLATGLHHRLIWALRLLLGIRHGRLLRFHGFKLLHKNLGQFGFLSISQTQSLIKVLHAVLHHLLGVVMASVLARRLCIHCNAHQGDGQY